MKLVLLGSVDTIIEEKMVERISEKYGRTKK